MRLKNDTSKLALHFIVICPFQLTQSTLCNKLRHRNRKRHTHTVGKQDLFIELHAAAIKTAIFQPTNAKNPNYQPNQLVPGKPGQL